MKKIISLLIFFVIFVINFCHAQSMASFNDEKKSHISHEINFSTELHTDCAKKSWNKPSNKSLEECCEEDFYSVLYSSSSEKKLKKIIISFFNINSILKKEYQENILSNISPPISDNYKNYYNYVSLIGIIKSNI